jgi:hypothetical protein
VKVIVRLANRVGLLGARKYVVREMPQRVGGGGVDGGDEGKGAKINN